MKTKKPSSIESIARNISTDSFLVGNERMGYWHDANDPFIEVVARPHSGADGYRLGKLSVKDIRELARLKKERP